MTMYDKGSIMDWLTWYRVVQKWLSKNGGGAENLTTAQSTKSDVSAVPIW